MSYDKLNFASFQEGLKTGKYESATGARRAVGKAAGLSDNEKDKARKLIDAHFGSSAPVAAKVTAKTAAAAKKAAKTKPAKEPKAAKAAPVKAEAKPAKVGRTKAVSAEKPVTKTVDATRQASTVMKMTTKLTDALVALTEARRVDPTVSLSAAVESFSLTFGEAAKLFKQFAASAQIPPPEAFQAPIASVNVAPAPAPSAPSNGLAQPSTGGGLFREALPGAD